MSHDDEVELVRRWGVEFRRRERERCAQLVKARAKKMRRDAGEQDTSAQGDTLEAMADILDELAEALERGEP